MCAGPEQTRNRSSWLFKTRSRSVQDTPSFFSLRKAFTRSTSLMQSRRLHEVCQIFCATANETEILVAQTGQGRGVLGVVDGQSPMGVEADEDIAWRKGFLRKIGYKS